VATLLLTTPSLKPGNKWEKWTLSLDYRRRHAGKWNFRDTCVSIGITLCNCQLFESQRYMFI